MDKGAGGRAKRILSWILAALIITGGAIAIGWFAGIALVELMEPGSKDLAEQMDELNAEAGGAVDGTGVPEGADAASEEDTEAPQVSLPSIMDEAFEQQDDGGASPFASPPWANNVSITPIDEAGTDPADAASGLEPAATDEDDEPIQQATQEPSEPQQAGEQVKAPQQGQAAASASSQATAPQTGSGTPETSQQPSQQTMYKVRVGPYSEKAGADEAAVALKEMGLPVLTVKDGSTYFIQIGAFSVWANADSLVQKVKASGFSAKIAN